MDPLVDLVLDRLFSGNAEARAIIEALPGPTARVQLAALKVSDGDIERLRTAAGLARTDWRDLLVSAGFAENPDAHEWWVVADLHRLSVTRLNATDRLDIEAFGRLLTALRGSDGDARHAIASEAAHCLRTYLVHGRSSDRRVASLIDAFEKIRAD